MEGTAREENTKEKPRKSSRRLRERKHLCTMMRREEKRKLIDERKSEMGRQSMWAWWFIYRFIESTLTHMSAFEFAEG